MLNVQIVNGGQTYLLAFVQRNHDLLVPLQLQERHA